MKQITSYVKDTNDFINKINAVSNLFQKQLPSNNGREIIIYKYTNRRGNISCKESIRQLLKEKLLKQRENFWILTLETLTPKGLNQELN